MRTGEKYTVTVDLGIVLGRLVKHPAYGKPAITVDLTGPVTLRQLIDLLGVPDEYIGFITVNGDRKDWAAKLGPGDKVILIPYITGG